MAVKMETRDDEANSNSWPSWSNWVLIAVILGSLLTIGATINDIW